MPRYFLRVEGVNLGSVIDDTDDLSTRRGGGLMVLNAVEQLADELELAFRDRKWERIATGASVGLFEFETDDAAVPEAVRAAAQHYLRTKHFDYTRENGKPGRLPLSVGTFVADVVPVGDSTETAEQLATAKNRWRQMQEPSTSLADVWKPSAEACYLNCVRPATEPNQIPDDPKTLVSRSVADRRDYGRTARSEFYRKVLDRDPGCDFTTEFQQISNRKTLANGAEAAAPSNTDNKLAVLYLDGNGFGKIGRAAMEEADGVKKFKDWSDGLKLHHAMLLGGLLNRTVADPSWRTKTGEVRLETLLWGGDEILWVVPAWKGWELAGWFFGEEHTVKLKAGDRPVTYAAGLVFCNTKAPIKNIVALAHRLAGDAKDAAKAVDPKHPPHRLAYEVLESFDDIHGDLDAHRLKWLPKRTFTGDEKEREQQRAAYARQLVLDPARLAACRDAAKAVADCDDFPTRQLYMTCKAWRHGESPEPHVARMDASAAKAALDRVRATFGGSESAYLHLLQMLPYTPSDNRP